MYYSKIIPMDIANGRWWRVSLFVSGCRRHCKGCFNQETWDFNYGEKFSWETVHELERLIMNPNVSGLSILGGDPFEPENRDWVEALCAYVKCNCPGKDIWVWTGYEFEDLRDLPMMRHIDILVDGPFVDGLKDLRLKYRGSSNQRVIDVNESMKSDEVILYCE